MFKKRLNTKKFLLKISAFGLIQIFIVTNIAVASGHKLNSNTYFLHYLSPRLFLKAASLENMFKHDNAAKIELLAKKDKAIKENIENLKKLIVKQDNKYSLGQVVDLDADLKKVKGVLEIKEKTILELLTNLITREEAERLIKLIDETILTIYDYIPFEFFKNFYMSSGFASGHGLEHTLDVLINSLHILSNDKNTVAKIDFPNLIRAVIFHDIAMSITGRNKHSILSRFVAETILIKSGVDENIAWKIGKIANAHHDSELAEYETKDGAEQIYETYYEAKVIKDADALNNAFALPRINAINLKRRGKLGYFASTLTIAQRVDDLLRKNLIAIDIINVEGKTEKTKDNLQFLFECAFRRRVPFYYQTVGAQRFVGQQLSQSLHEIKDLISETTAQTGWFSEEEVKQIFNIVNTVFVEYIKAYQLNYFDTKKNVVKNPEARSRLQKLIDNYKKYLDKEVSLSLRERRDFYQGFSLTSHEINAVEMLEELRQNVQFQERALEATKIANICERLFKYTNDVSEKELTESLTLLRQHLLSLKAEKDNVLIDEILNGIKLDVIGVKNDERYKTKFIKKLRGELTAIVDEKDNIVEITERGLAHLLGLRHRTANVFILTPEGKLLLQRRSPIQSYGLFLSIFGGHVKYPETYDEAIIDEIVSELNLSSTPSGNVSSLGQEFYDDPDDLNREYRKFYSYQVPTQEKYG